jgi:hypothetical protein
MRLTNRSLLLVRLKAPYVAWANKYPPKQHQEIKSPQEIQGETSAYLVEVDDRDVDGSIALRSAWREIFENELDGWHSDPAAWPKPRTFTLFQEWFDVEFISAVRDQGRDEIEGETWVIGDPGE